MRSDVDSLPGSKLWYRAMVAYLHFIQPLARVRGRIRGVLSPPEIALPHRPSRRPAAGRGRRSREAWRALLLLSGNVTEDRFWSETWTSADRVLSQLTDWLRRSRAVRTIEIDEGWSDDRDVSVLVGRWAWLDVRALVEEHGGGKSLLRVSTHLRPTTLRRRQRALALGVGAPARRAAFGARAALAAGGRDRRPVLDAAVDRGVASWRTAQATAIVRRGIARVTLGAGMVAMPSGPARAPLLAPSLLRIVRPAQRDDLRRDDRGARRRHVHAARGGHRPGDRRHEGLRRRLRPGHRRVARHAGRHRRRAERRHLHRRLEQRRDPPDRRAATR